MSEYLQKSLRGASVSFIMALCAAFLSYLIRVIFARTLGPEEYGLFYGILTFILFFLFLRDLGLGKALTKFISHAHATNQKEACKTIVAIPFIFQLLSSFFFISLVLIFANTLARDYFQDARAASILALLTIYIVTSVLFRLEKQTFQGVQKMFLFSSIEVVKNAVVLLLAFLFFSLGHSLYAAVLSFVLVGPILTLIYLPSFLKIIPFRSKIREFKTTTCEMFKFGLPALTTAVGGKIIGYIDTLILVGLVSLREVGIYNVVLPSAIIFLFIGRALSSVVFPMSSELQAKKEYKKLQKGIGLAHRYSLLLMLPIVVFLFTFAEVFLGLLFGLEYISGATAFRVLLFGILLYIVAQSNNSLLSGIGKPKIVMYITLFAAGINILLNLFLIPLYSINGAALATTISYALAFILSFYSLRKEISLKIDLSLWSRLFATIVILFGSVSLFSKILSEGLLLVIAGTFLFEIVLFFLLVWVLQLSSLAELKKFIRVFRGKKSKS